MQQRRKRIIVHPPTTQERVVGMFFQCREAGALPTNVEGMQWMHIEGDPIKYRFETSGKEPLSDYFTGREIMLILKTLLWNKQSSNKPDTLISLLKP